MSLIAVGDQSEVTLDGATTPIFGTVSAIGLLSTSDAGVAAYPVTVAVTGDQAGLHDGVSATVKLIYERRTDVLTVPSLAVTTANGEVDRQGRGRRGQDLDRRRHRRRDVRQRHRDHQGTRRGRRRRAGGVHAGGRQREQPTAATAPASSPAVAEGFTAAARVRRRGRHGHHPAVQPAGRSGEWLS